MSKRGLISSNSSLGAFFALLKIFRISQTASLASILKIFKNTKLPPQILELFDKQKYPSLRDSRSESKQSKQNQSCVSTLESRPLRGAKNRIQGCSSATRRFFARSGNSESTPLKAKSGSFWRVGERGGGAALLREKANETKTQNLKNNSTLDSVLGIAI